MLRALADAVDARVRDAEDRRRLALGLFNAHFSSLPADGRAAPALVEDFLHLFHLLLVKGVREGDLPGAAGEVYRLALLALADEPRRAPAGLGGDPGATPRAREDPRVER